MVLTEDEIIEKYGKNCGHCNRNFLLPNEHDWSCLSCGIDSTKRKHELTKIHWKKSISSID